ncbi:CAZyme family GH55 [Paecilomyces variotii]|nr:CAZyme family GH55 [Paecilomyces variotii]KAJ9286725.1 CAZyme family GH55 [Paecilomyces variotii]KAJ9368003.1 CAZyme family GH55 [Paecilomyces variotii]
MLFIVHILLLLGLSTFLVDAAPMPQASASAATSDFWVSTIKRQGTTPFGQSNYQVYRNVKDFGAKGDGSTDDTDAINKAISSGNRCGENCDSSTVTPALVYFPPGTYVVSKPIIEYYYTQMVGDALDIPTLKAAPGFQGIAVIDADPYNNDGSNWYTNQNNFFRSVRNFVIDLTAMPQGSGAGIHWQVAQASSLQNIRFEMVKGGGDANKQMGIFMDNGSGGFMTDLTFNGGNYGMFLGNQQFTTRNMTFNDCNTAIFMNWNWLWTFKSLNINNCQVGLNMSNSPQNQTVGSVLIADSKLTNTPKGVITAFTTDSIPIGGGALVLNNVDFTGSTVAVAGLSGNTILAGGSVIDSWMQGNTYTPQDAQLSISLKARAEPPKVRRDVCIARPPPSAQPPAPESEAPAPAPASTQAPAPAAPAPVSSEAPAAQPSVAVSQAPAPVSVQTSAAQAPAPVSSAVSQVPAAQPASSSSASPAAQSQQPAEGSASGAASTSAAASASDSAIPSEEPKIGISLSLGLGGGSSTPTAAPSVPALSSILPIPTASSTTNAGQCAASPVVKSRSQAKVTTSQFPKELLDSQGNVFERSKPQYETVPASSFVSVKSAGAKGDGSTDDTAAIQKVLDSATEDQIVYFDHGNYIITSTLKVPKNIKITGEIWPVLMASGKAFSDEKNPIPMIQVGQAGDVGSVELSDLVISTKGPAPGAILMEWNVKQATQGSAGMWDVHFRVGGTAGTELQDNKCAKDPKSTVTPNPECFGAFMLMHVTKDATMYNENSWYWVSDHDLDSSSHNQVSIFNGRGVLLENQGPVWMYGTASEHSQLYNYQIANAKNVYMALIQTETPYYQSNPNALTPFTPQTSWNDPDFSTCTTNSCRKAWGVRVFGSSDIHVFGAGIYSFFDNYGQTCLAGESCQENIVQVDCSDVHFYGLSTKASTNMVTSSSGKALVPQIENVSNFCSTIALFQQSAQ